MLLAGKSTVAGMGEGDKGVWLGLALSDFLLVLSLRNIANGNGFVRLEFYMIPGDFVVR